jgi:hypothetical protein
MGGGNKRTAGSTYRREAKKDDDNILKCGKRRKRVAQGRKRVAQGTAWGDMGRGGRKPRSYLGKGGGEQGRETHGHNYALYVCKSGSEKKRGQESQNIHIKGERLAPKRQKLPVLLSSHHHCSI